MLGVFAVSVMRATVVGFRVHTGWAAAVAVAAERDAPAIAERRRIVYEPAAGRFLYHTAAELPPAAAAKLIARAQASSRSAATREIDSLLTHLRRGGLSIALASIPAGNAKLPGKLSDILAAHSHIHSAEGAFYRDVLARACEGLGVVIERPPERDLWTLAADALHLERSRLEPRLKALGAGLGPPWGEDQKLAALAAWISFARAQKPPACIRAMRP